MSEHADRIRGRNAEIVDVLEPYAEELSGRLEESGLGADHLPGRGEVSAQEYVTAYRDSPLDLNDGDHDRMKRLELDNVRDHVGAVMDHDALDGVDTAASLYCRDDVVSMEAIDADWYPVDMAYAEGDAVDGGVAGDCARLPFADGSLDLVLLRAPGGAFIPDAEDVLDEVGRALDDDGVFVASDAYVRDPDGYEEVGVVGPSPAVYHSRLDGPRGEVRNAEGDLRLYRPE